MHKTTIERAKDNWGWTITCACGVSAYRGSYLEAERWAYDHQDSVPMSAWDAYFAAEVLP